MEGLTPLIPVKIYNQQTRLILDTGAFSSMLAPGSAKKFGLRVGGLSLLARFEGVNGQFQAGLAKVGDLTVLGRPFKDIYFLVGGPEFDRDISGLFGQDFLNVEDGEYDLANGAMRIFRPKGCEGANLAYWAEGKPYSVIPISPTETHDRRIRGQATVNGVPINVVFDSGSPDSYMTLHAAARAGLNPKDPGVTPGGLTGGIGRGAIESWLAPVKSFKIGDEEIQNTRIRIGNINIDGDDMLLGADFFLSHRIYVANSQRRLYFTYDGGPVFNLDSAATPEAPGVSGAAAPAASGQGLPASLVTDAPQDASGFARRGRAFAARHEYAQALADLSRAIELEPGIAQHLYERGQVYLEQKQLQQAMADFDQAVKLKPNDISIRLARGALHLKNLEFPAAKADFDAALALDDTLRMQIANTYVAGGDLEDGVAVYDLVLTSKPEENTRLRALSGRCWSRALWNRDLDKALADCNQALRLSPTWDSPLMGRAMIRLRQGQYDSALGDFDRVARDGLKTAWVLYGRGLARCAVGKTADGEADLKAAAEMDPDLPAQAKRYGLSR
jgi:tetratricopeptide (TPR) repeat protein/predicted aspartyl protease